MIILYFNNKIKKFQLKYCICSSMHLLDLQNRSIEIKAILHFQSDGCEPVPGQQVDNVPGEAEELVAGHRNGGSQGGDLEPLDLPSAPLPAGESQVKGEPLAAAEEDEGYHTHQSVGEMQGQVADVYQHQSTDQ